MSPERRQFTPEEVQRIGREKWTHDIKMAREAVEKFKQAYTPKEEKNINEGIRNLIACMYAEYDHSRRLLHVRERTRRREEIDLEKAKKTLRQIFERNLQDSPPKEVPFVPFKGQVVLKVPKLARITSKRILPRNIAFLIEYFRLDGGEQRTMKQIAEEHGVSSEVVSDGLARALSRLAYHEEIHSLILEKK